MDERQNTAKAMEANKVVATALLNQLLVEVEEITNPIDAECVRLELQQILDNYCGF